MRPAGQFPAKVLSPPLEPVGRLLPESKGVTHLVDLTDGGAGRLIRNSLSYGRMIAPSATQ